MNTTYKTKMMWMGLLLLLGASGCATAAAPQVRSPLDVTAFAERPAMIDASRAWPIAFFAEPETPTLVQVPLGVRSADLYLADWLQNLAHQLNGALAQRGLYDGRAATVTARVVEHAVVDGRDAYFVQSPKQVRRDVWLAAVRAVWLKVEKAAVIDEGGDRQFEIILLVSGLGLDRRYRVRVRDSDFDRSAFQSLGEAIVGDGSFWASIEAHGLERLATRR